MVSIFSSYILVFIGLSLLSIGLGSLFYRSDTDNPFSTLFFQMLLGSITIAILISSVSTVLKTIHLAYLPIIGMFWYSNRNKKINLKSLDHRLLLFVLVGVVFVFSWSFFTRIIPGEFPFVIPLGTELAPNDINTYGWLSHFMGSTGHENYFGVLNTIDDKFHGVKPYHYLEMWLSFGLTKVFGGLTILNLSLVVIPFFHFQAFLAILAIWEKFGKVTWLTVALSLALLLTTGLFLQIYKGWGYTQFNLPILTYRWKMCTYYPFLFGTLLLWLRGKKELGLILLMGLPIASVVPAPTIFASIGVFLILCKYMKWMDWIEIKRTLGSLIVVAGYMYIFYQVFGNNSIPSGLEIKWSEMGALFLEAGNIMRAGSKFWYAITHILLMYSPFVLIVVLRSILHKRGLFAGVNTPMLVLVCLMIIISGTMWAVLQDFMQSSQLFYNVSIPVANLVVVFILIRVLAGMGDMKSRFRTGLLIALVATIWVSTFIGVWPELNNRNFKPRNHTPYSQNYLETIDSFAKQMEIPALGGAIKGWDDYISQYSKRPASYSLGYYLEYMENGIGVISLSDLEIPISSEWETENEKDIASGAFYQFVQGQRDAGEFVSNQHSQLTFTEKYNLQFIIASRNASIPDWLNEKSAIYFVDKLSGEKFFLLK